MAPKLILLAGAPAPSSVVAASCTVHGLDPKFSTLLDWPVNDTALVPPSSTIPHAAWRSLSLDTRRPFHTSFSQIHDIHNESLLGHRHFFTTAEISVEDESVTRDPEEDPEAALTQFCEQSLAALDPTGSSAPLDSLNQSASMLDETSFMTSDSADRTDHAAEPRIEPTIPSHLSDLEDVPTARQVLALVPQTVTLNLIVGIISIAQPRTVTTRWGHDMTLVEVLVGDDTATGFAVTFWLNSQDPSPVVAKLRRQDVVLMHNVALHVFRNKVYGQSLRRGLTKVEVLWRSDGSGHYSSRALAKGAPKNHPQRQKVSDVRQWVLKFVGADPGSRRSRAGRKSWDMPPDDTQ